MAGMKYILQIELDNYLWGRRRNYLKKEKALIDADPDQAFVWYNKAALVLYGLKDLIGEDSLNKALHEFRDEYAFRDKPPFAGSDDLYRSIKKHVPDSLQYYLTDSWEKITLYDNKVLEASATPTGKNDEYKVHIKVSAGKTYTDTAGNNKPALQMNDYIDIGIFAADSKNKEGRTIANPLYLKKHKLTAGEHVMDIIVKGKPVRVGIDPYGKLIDDIPGRQCKKFMI